MDATKTNNKISEDKTQNNDEIKSNKKQNNDEIKSNKNKFNDDFVKMLDRIGKEEDESSGSDTDDNIKEPEAGRTFLPEETKPEPLKIKQKIRIVGFYPVFNMVTRVETCKICRSELQAKCINCVTEDYSKSKGCVISKGICGCMYHTHCLTNWLASSALCPEHTSDNWVDKK